MDRTLSPKPGRAYLVFIALPVLLSFYTFSEYYYPRMSSDIAVTILMSLDFHIPGDLYFWGQDRAGSLIPMLANLPVAAGLPPVFTVGLIHWFLLLLGYASMAALFRERWPRVILAWVWFLPMWHFQDFVLLLFGVQASMAACMLFCLRSAWTAALQPKRLLWLSMALLAAILAGWVSDSAIVSLFALVPAGLAWLGTHKKEPERRVHVKKFFSGPVMAVVAAWLVLGMMFLYYAKATAVRAEGYHAQMLNSPSEAWASVVVVLTSVAKVFLFSSERISESISAWILLGGFIAILFLSLPSLKHAEKGRQRFLPMFFLAEGALMLALLVLSHWVYANGTGRRYFCLPYLSAWLFLLFYFDGKEFPRKAPVKIIFLLMALLGTISGWSGFWIPKKQPSTVSVFRDFARLGEAGVIAEYWNSYRTAGTNPRTVIATPHDRDQVRNPELVQKVFSQPNLYIIKDQWLEAFPDTLVQFGRTLVKDGEEFRAGDCLVCRYVVVTN